MDRRTFEGPMDWEYQNNRGPMDMSSPFTQISQHQRYTTSFGSPAMSKENPFAKLASAQPPSPSKQAFPRPPSSSLFNPSGSKAFPTASAFRNPAFTTPQKRTEEILSEYSGAEESPAVASDASEMVCDTPEYDHYDKDMASMTITPASAVNRKLFHNHHQKQQQPSQAIDSSPNAPNSPVQMSPSRTSGRGDVPRGKLDLVFTRRDRVRKRKRNGPDQDVSSVRSRFHVSLMTDDDDEEDDGDEESDDSDVSERGLWRSRRSGKSKKSSHKNAVKENKRGVIGNLFSAIHDHPNVPLILSWWVQLAINVFVVSIFVWFVWGGIRMMQNDIAHASDAARSRLLSEMNACAHEYTKNRCAPKSERLPALSVMCDEWEVCMNQDPASVMGMQVSAKNVAEIINEFVGAMSIKAWGFIISAMLAMVLASNLGFSRFRETAFMNNQSNMAATNQQPFPSQPAGPPSHLLASPPQDPNQAYIWAPIGQTPRHIRREFLTPDTPPTDTDASPDAHPSAPAAIMAPPQTPSFRRSPTKDRQTSPSKGRRTGKNY